MAKSYIMTTTSFASLSEDERPREKALNHGMSTLSDVELLALLFGTGTRGNSVLQMAQEILDKHEGHLSAVAALSPQAFINQFKGVGPAKALTVLGALELGMRAAADAARIRTNTITSSQVAYDIMKPNLAYLDHEEFWVLMMNNAANCLKQECVGIGGQTATVVDVKILMRKILEHKATRIIVFHNHPSGQLRHSMQDDTLTRKIQCACQTLDIRMDDHIIVTSSGFYSYNDEGRLR